VIEDPWRFLRVYSNVLGIRFVEVTEGS